MAGIVLRGRSEQMAVALGLIRKATRTGRAEGLMITGEAGIGKSALLSAVVREAGRLDAVCATVRADRVARAVPGGPLLTALRDGPDPVLPTAASAPLESLTEQPLLLLEALANALELRAAERAVVVAIDDAKWLDDLSAFVLRSLPGRLPRSPITWLLASRTDGLPLLERLRGNQDGEPPFTGIDLRPLAVSDIMAIALDQLGAVPGPAQRQLLERAGGNPFLATKVISGLLRARENGVAPCDLPEQLVCAVRRQLQSLPSDAVQLVRLAAVYGETLSVDDAAELLDGLSAQEVAEAAEEATTEGILSNGQATLAFRYKLVREAIYADLSARSRQSMHLSCARHLRETGCDALVVAAHAREALTPGDEAVALLLADAANDASRAAAKTAAELMLAAFDSLRPGQSSWLALGERCVELLSLVQRCTDALDVAGRLMAYLDEDESIGRLEIALSRSLWLAGRWAEAEERSRLTLERKGLSSALRARLEALHALALSRVESPALARPMAERALATSGSSADRTGRLFALHALAEIARNTGDHRTSLAYFRRLRAESEPAYIAQEIMALQHLDRYSHADAMLELALRQFGDKSAATLPSLLYAQIWQDYNLARLDDAEATAGGLMRLGKEKGSRICELESASLLSAVSVLRGDVTEARRRISLGGRPGLEELAHVPLLTLVRGWLMAEEGDAALAIRLLTPLLKAAQDELDPWPWKPGWMPMLAHIGISAADPAFAVRAVELAEEGASRNRGVATFEAIAAGLRGLLDHDLDQLALAARTVTHSPRALIQAGIYADYGRAQLAVGDLAAGGDLLDQAWAVYDQVGALAARSRVQRAMRAAGLHRTWWPAGQPRPSKGWNALTEAEMRVARLIGEGQTNKSAAAELGVSANTIGTHLRSVFSKLGVQSRVQLTNLLHAQDDALARAGAQPLE